VCPTQPYVVNAHGDGLRRLSTFYGDLLFGGPLWTPDGRTIAFSASNKPDRWGIGIHAPNKAIYAVNPDGSHLTLLVPAPQMGTNQLLVLASWSPDGRHILYVRVPWNPSKGPQATALWVMNANGSGQRRLYRVGNARIGDATWSPDGKLIAFAAASGSRSGLFVMSADGRHLHRLAAGGWGIAWRPVP